MRVARSHSLAFILLTAVFLILPGCKLEIRVPTGGRVVSSDGAFICESGQSCMIDVVDIFFDQTFIAEPDHGYYFGGWRTKDNYLCGGEATPCSLSTASFEGNPVLEALLESDETFHLQPRFVFSLTACPEPELVVSPAITTD